MKHRYLKLFFAALLCIATTGARAHDFEVDGIYYKILSAEDKTVAVTYKGSYGSAYSDEYTGTVSIPESVTYNGTTYSVTRIQESTFSSCTGLTSITIPNSVTSIGEVAFDGCNFLEEVHISDIAAWCDIIFADNPLKKAHNLYLNGELVTDLVIPDGVTVIASKAFYGCTSLTSVTIPNSVTIIGISAFENCTGLTSIVIGKNVTSIGNYAFGGCTALKNLHIKEGEGKLLLGYQYYGNPYTQTKGKGLFYDCPLETVFIGKELDFKRDYATGYTPFRLKNIDTITISKPQQMNLEFGNNSKHITLLFIDYNSYYRVIPTNLTQNSSLYYFNHPINNSNYKNATEYLKKSLNCKAKMVMLGDVQTDYHSISVALNDTLIIPENIALSTAPNNIIFRAVNINGEDIIPDNDGKYLSSNLQIATEYPVILKYKYNDQKHTTSTTIRTKAIKPTSSSTTTLTTAKINFSEGDTIGLNSPINEIGVEFNGERYTAEKNYKELELKNLGPSSQYGYRVYCIIDSVIHYGDYMYFTTKTPSIAIANLTTTQTTAILKIAGTYSDDYLSPIEVGVNVNGRYYVADDKFNVLVDGLTPSTTYTLQPYVKYENYGIYYGTSKTITTSSITVDCNVTATTATTISLKGTHDVGDATLLENGFVDGEFNSENMTITGLDPDTEYSFTYYVTTEEAGRIEKQVTVRTEPLKFNTLKAKATSNTKAIICAEANIANEEAGTGFEWRRIDAPDLVPSEIVSCAVHEGVMEGALHNLSANTYYKYRPYYTAASGKSYYGEWIGFGTADAYVYFTPTVHTYATASAGTNAARLSGYVLAGSDDIIEQGFEYWPVGKAEAATMHNTHSDGNVRRVTATGQRMSVIIEELEYGTIYMCRAYARTAKETVYGEEQSFETSFPTGIKENREKNITIQTAGNTVYINGYNENETVFVYTLFGAVVYNGPEKEITLNSGTYIVKVGNITKKIQIR
ncbi:MAG: leucine-rich repeat domain-containing protein [Bacteroidaceae bacterium]|nr:leucine-rich repeat domain-containing protein [Bacteroidaceae bacterium]